MVRLSGKFHPRPLLLTLGLGAAALIAPAASAQTLVMGVGAAVTSIDPHFSDGVSLSIAMHVYDRMIERAPDAKLIPGLATSWQPVSDTAWDFHLRHGVKWQDGGDFTADDVVFTINRVRQPTKTMDSLVAYLRTITTMEVIDPYTLRIHTSEPTPDLPGGLSLIAIISRHAATGATTDDFNSGKATMGTGAYKLVHYVPGQDVELERNDQWWGKKPAWQKVIYRPILNPGSRIAALLAGDVEIIDQVSPTDMPRLTEDPRTHVVSTDGLRALYLALDVHSADGGQWITDNDGNKLPANPLQDLRVRQAMSLAINRDAIETRTMQNGATANGQFLPKGTFGYDPERAHLRYDPQAAQALMIAAGYPKGFHITVHTSNDRFFGAVETMQALASMWGRIGIKAELKASPWATFVTPGLRHELAVSYWAWGNNTAEAGASLFNVVATPNPALKQGVYNNGAYSNPALDELVKRALTTVDAAAREKLLIQAVRMESDDVAVIHLYQIKNIWALRRNLNYTPRVDQRTIATQVTVAP